MNDDRSQVHFYNAESYFADLRGQHCFTKVSKVIHVTGSGGLYGFEMLRILHCLDSRLKDDSEVVSITRRLRFTPRNIIFLCMIFIYVRS
jgi:hypothetical protein